MKIDPYYMEIEAKDIEAIISRQIALEDSPYFQNLTIDGNSVEVIPVDAILHQTTTLPSTVYSQAITQTPPPPRVCTPLQVRKYY